MAGETDWKEGLPEDLRADPSIKDFKDVASLAKSFKETKALVGASVRPPGPDAAPEVRKEFIEKMLKVDPSLVYLPDGAKEEELAPLWRRLGRPEKVDELPVPEGLDKTQLHGLATAMGLTKGQYAKLAEVMGGSATESKAAAAKEQADLKAEWGQAYEERLLMAKATALKMGMAESDLGSLTPKQLRVWAATAKAIGTAPTEFQRQQDGGGNGKLTPAEAKAQLAEIRNRPEYFDKYKNPALHEQLKAKVLELTKAMYPG